MLRTLNPRLERVSSTADENTSMVVVFGNVVVFTDARSHFSFSIMILSRLVQFLNAFLPITVKLRGTYISLSEEQP